jgi:type I restriction enzyme S subunit
MSWKKTKIGKFLFEREGRFKPNDKSLLNLNRLEKIDFSGNFHIGQKASRTDMILIKRGDFVISGINVSKGAMGIYRESSDITATIHYSSYTFDESKIDINYFEHFLQSDEFVKLLEDQVKGGIKTEIKAKHLLNLEIYLPSLEEQKQIAKKFKHSEEKQKFLQQQIDNQKTNLKNLRKQILQDAIEGKLTKEWREKNPDIDPASELLKKIKQQKEKLIFEKKIKKEKPLPPIDKNEIPFELPMDWVWVGISEIGLCHTGDSINESVKSLKYKVLKSGLNYIGTKDVGFEFRGVNYDTSVIIPFDEAGTEFKIAKKGSIFVCIEGGSSGKKIALLDRDVCFGNKLLATQVFSPVSYEYVYLVYQTFLFESEFRNKSKGLRGGVSVNLFKTIKIPLPPLSEQLAIVSKLKTLIQKLDEAEKQIENSLETSKLLTKAILTEAFQSHQVKVN